MKDVLTCFNYLSKVIDDYGYHLEFSTYYYVKSIQTGNAVDHIRKAVITMPRVTEREIIGICHEIGHIKDRIKNNNKRDRNKKNIKIYEEVIAWIYAIPLLIKCRTPLRLTIHNIYFSLKSYFKTR